MYSSNCASVLGCEVMKDRCEKCAAIYSRNVEANKTEQSSLVIAIACNSRH